MPSVGPSKITVKKDKKKNDADNCKAFASLANAIKLTRNSSFMLQIPLALLKFKIF